MREGGGGTKANEKRCRLPFRGGSPSPVPSSSIPASSIFFVFILPKRGTCVSRRYHATPVHYYFSAAPTLPLPPPPPSRPFASTFRFFLCLLGNLAVVMRRSVPMLGGMLARGMMSTMEKVKEERRAGSAGEDTVPERDLDAIFKSGATSILPPLPLFLSFSFRLLSRLLLPLSPSAILQPEDAGYRNTALNRPRGLTLTRDHPLVGRGLPCRFLNFVSPLRRTGNFDRGGFRQTGTNEGGSDA